MQAGGDHPPAPAMAPASRHQPAFEQLDAGVMGAMWRSGCPRAFLPERAPSKFACVGEYTATLGALLCEEAGAGVCNDFEVELRQGAPSCRPTAPQRCASAAPNRLCTLRPRTPCAPAPAALVRGRCALARSRPLQQIGLLTHALLS